MEKVNYSMESRPKEGLYIYIHDEKPRTTAFNLQVLRGYNESSRRKNGSKKQTYCAGAKSIAQ
ncbi:MAG: hypothetical protein ACKPKO_15895, partial [Candidatus Fonsibacter sp.]